MEKLASEYVDMSLQKGTWLMLMNCHLLTSWLKNTLEKKL